jgi:hypothetical protein
LTFVDPKLWPIEIYRKLGKNVLPEGNGIIAELEKEFRETVGDNTDRDVNRNLFKDEELVYTKRTNCSIKTRIQNIQNQAGTGVGVCGGKTGGQGAGGSNNGGHDGGTAGERDFGKNALKENGYKDISGKRKIIHQKNKFS